MARLPKALKKRRLPREIDSANRVLDKRFKEVFAVQEQMYTEEEFADIVTEYTGITLTVEKVRAIKRKPMNFLGPELKAFLNTLGYTFDVIHYHMDIQDYREKPLRMKGNQPATRYRKAKALFNKVVTIEQMGLRAISLKGTGSQEAWVELDAQGRQDIIRVCKEAIERNLTHLEKLSEPKR